MDAFASPLSTTFFTDIHTNSVASNYWDIKTLAAERLGLEFKQVSKRRMPKHWFRGCPKHTHIALDDALSQGVLLMNILKDKEVTRN